MTPRALEERQYSVECGRVNTPRLDELAATDVITRRAQAAWPDLDVDMGEFVIRILGLLNAEQSKTQSIEHLAIEDLYLAFACAQRHPKAIEILVRTYEKEFQSVVAKIHAVDVDDARQMLWDRLLCANARGVTKILEFRGEGRLRYWIRSVAARVLLDEHRRLKRDGGCYIDDTDAIAAIASTQDGEVAAIRHKYGEAFRAAFKAALQSLEPDERNSLRCYYLASMTIDEISSTFGVHRATAARRVARAREHVLHATRNGLAKELGATSTELDSIMRLCDYDFSVSLSKIFE